MVLQKYKKSIIGSSIYHTWTIFTNYKYINIIFYGNFQIAIAPRPTSHIIQTHY